MVLQGLSDEEIFKEIPELGKQASRMTLEKAYRLEGTGNAKVYFRKTFSWTALLLRVISVPLPKGGSWE